MASSVGQVAEHIRAGADALDAMPTGQLERDMRRLHTNDILAKVASAMMLAQHVRGAVTDLRPTSAEIARMTGVVGELWATALQGTNAGEADALQARATNLLEGDGISVATLVHGGVTIEAKLMEVEGQIDALLRTVSELDDIRVAWQLAAEGFTAETSAVAHDARTLAASMGGEE